MGDLMLFGVLRMDYDMVMSDELSRRQFYDRAQQAADEIERLRSLLALSNKQGKEYREKHYRAESNLERNDSEIERLRKRNALLEDVAVAAEAWHLFDATSDRDYDEVYRALTDAIDKLREAGDA